MKLEETQGQYSVVEVEDLSWPLKKISEIADVNPRIDKKTIPDDMPVSFVPMPAVGAGDGSIRVDETRLAGEVKKGFTAFLEGDILFAKITPCMENGKMAVAPALVNGYGFGSTEFHVLRPKPGTHAKYLYYYVSSQSFRKEAERHMTGAVGQRRVPTAYLKECTIPVPPLNQQKRIVAEIEKQFSRLSGAVNNLKRVKANLKRYRAAVLKAAVEGRLVETEAEIARKQSPSPLEGDGRGEGATYETGEQLLQRILQERRRKWEETELAKMQARGKPPKNDKWKQKYKEPAAPDTTNLPELPEGWVWANVDLIAKIVGGGTPSKEYPDYWVDGTIPWVSPKDMKVSKISDSTDHITELALEKTSVKMIPGGSVLVVTRSGILAHTFPVAVTTKSVTVNQDIKAFVTNQGIAAEYLALVLRAFSQEILNKCSKHGTTVASVDTHAISRFPLPFPPLAEQHRIVTEVDRHLSILRETETQVEANLQRAEGLRQSVLASFFNVHYKRPG